MNCPDCGGELSAVGGVPTLWLCGACTDKDPKKRPKKFVGDTLKEFRRL